MIKNREIIEDSFQTVLDDAAALPDGDIIVSLTRWKAEKAALTGRSGRVGVLLQADEEAEDIAQDLAKLDVIALDFPVFRDGRNYSNARILRDQLGYAGELRAVGDVLRDQLFYLYRCGFNAFVIREDRDMEDALQGLQDFTVLYQPAADEKLPLWKRRKRG